MENAKNEAEKCAVVFLADGFEEVEALTPVDYLRRTHSVQVVTVAVPSETMNDPYIVTGSHGIPVIADMSFDEFKQNFMQEKPDLIFFPGGMNGSKNLAANKELYDFTIECNEQGKIISAICAAPAIVLAKTGVLKGKNWTCYPEMEKSVEQFCSAFTDSNGNKINAEEVLKGSTHKKDVPFVLDKNVVTGRGAGTAEQFAMGLVRLLAGEELFLKVKKDTLQR